MIEVFLHLVEKGEVLVRGLVASQCLLEDPDHPALSPVGDGHIALETDLEDAEGVAPERVATKGRPLSHRVRRLRGIALRPAQR